MGWSEWKNFGSMSLLKEVSYQSANGYTGKYFNFDLSDISGYQNLVLFENFFLYSKPMCSKIVHQIITEQTQVNMNGHIIIVMVFLLFIGIIIIIQILQHML